MPSTILIVDDDLAVQTSLLLLLDTLGHRLVTASGMEEAVQKFGRL